MCDILTEELLQFPVNIVIYRSWVWDKPNYNIGFCYFFVKDASERIRGTLWNGMVSL